MPPEKAYHNQGNQRQEGSTRFIQFSTNSARAGRNRREPVEKLFNAGQRRWRKPHSLK